MLFLVCILLLTPNMPTVYMAKKFNFGSDLTIAPVPVIVPMMFGKLQTFEFVGCSQKGLPFQRGCWYGDGILWLISRLCDPKTQLKSAVLLCVGTTCTCKFTTVPNV